MRIKRFTYILLSLAATVLFGACSNDDEVDANGYGKTTKVKVSLATRATGTPEAPENPQELINDWWVLFVNNSNKIVKYIDRASTTKATSAVEREEFDMEIATGDYTAYSFANITKDQVETVTGSLAVGNTMPDLTSVKFDVSSFNGANVPSTTNIPMTGMQTVRFASGGMQMIELEVVRMLAKMEFQYKNQSAVGLFINSLSIKQVQETSVPLLPNYTYLNNGWTFENLTTSTAFIPGPFTRSYSSPISVAAYSGSGDPASQTDKFYMIESQADYNTPTQSYLMTLNVTRNGEANDLYFSLDKGQIQTIYRNDHVIVPLVISDYIVGLDVIFYPPIGGYPAVITEDKDKDEFYCTFATQGEFEIKPTVYNASTKTNVYYPDWDYSSPAITVSDPDGLFESELGGIAPHIDTTTGELLGKLSTATGTASIDVKIKVKTSSDPVVYRDYTRRIYIIRKNAS